jgi:hypothetical protein
MRDVKTTRRFAQLQDARERIMAELDKPDVPQEQRTVLLVELVRLQLAVSKKWKRHTENRRKRKGNNPHGRPKKMFDSAGQPLYNNSPKPPKPEDTTSKKAFLEGITGGPAETESDS